MSGVCSHHQGHDPACPLCTIVPLTPDEESYYEGWEARYTAMRANGWSPVEEIVLDVYEALESATRAGDQARVQAALDQLSHMRQLNRGFGR